MYIQAPMELGHEEWPYDRGVYLDRLLSEVPLYISYY